MPDLQLRVLESFLFYVSDASSIEEIRDAAATAYHALQQQEVELLPPDVTLKGEVRDENGLLVMVTRREESKHPDA